MLDVKSKLNLPPRNRDFKRPEFWTTRTWQVRPPEPPATPFEFPEDDLIAKLVHLYFEKINLFFPLLHRVRFSLSCLQRRANVHKPTLQRYIDQKKHYTDRYFAHVLLLCKMALSTPSSVLIYCQCVPARLAIPTTLEYSSRS